ncbi:hypothetical protein A2W24_04215 [Microgenomates group bacterium RBG_16_45_19]|nr:MAG: hypothetical protein A2W24_04215 [Microgenomates group bacterium RBG_16_45_19]
MTPSPIKVNLTIKPELVQDQLQAASVSVELAQPEDLTVNIPEVQALTAEPGPSISWWGLLGLEAVLVLAWLIWDRRREINRWRRILWSKS